MSEPQNQMQDLPDYGAPPIQPSTPQPEPARMGPWQRLIGILFSPGETFQDLNRKPTWLIAMLLIAVVSGAYMIFVNSQTDEGWRQMIREQASQSGRSGGAARPEDLELGIKIGKWGTVGAVVLGTPIYCLIIAGVFALTFMIMQAETTFKKILSVVTWSICSTGIIQTIVSAASLLARDAESLSRLQPKDFGTISATNLAVALPSGSSPALVALAASFDLFTIWFLILLVLGFTAVSGARRITRAKVAWVVFGLWIVAILIKVASASVFGR